jgi:hypothetical protein
MVVSGSDTLWRILDWCKMHHQLRMVASIHKFDVNRFVKFALANADKYGIILEAKDLPGSLAARGILMRWLKSFNLSLTFQERACYEAICQVV